MKKNLMAALTLLNSALGVPMSVEEARQLSRCLKAREEH